MCDNRISGKYLIYWGCLNSIEGNAIVSLNNHSVGDNFHKDIAKAIYDSLNQEYKSVVDSKNNRIIIKSMTRLCDAIG